jgi:hypothetical protein
MSSSDTTSSIPTILSSRGSSWVRSVIGSTYTTICLRPRRGLRMNLRVRRVTGCSRSAILRDVRGDRTESLSATVISRQMSEGR